MTVATWKNFEEEGCRDQEKENNEKRERSEGGK